MAFCTVYTPTNQQNPKDIEKGIERGRERDVTTSKFFVYISNGSRM
jgi:hypothetical protein